MALAYLHISLNKVIFMAQIWEKYQIAWIYPPSQCLQKMFWPMTFKITTEKSISIWSKAEMKIDLANRQGPKKYVIQHWEFHLPIFQAK